jgi:hypothetical protein
MHVSACDILAQNGSSQRIQEALMQATRGTTLSVIAFGVMTSSFVSSPTSVSAVADADRDAQRARPPISLTGCLRTSEEPRVFRLTGAVRADEESDDGSAAAAGSRTAGGRTYRLVPLGANVSLKAYVGQRVEVGGRFMDVDELHGTGESASAKGAPAKTADKEAPTKEASAKETSPKEASPKEASPKEASKDASEAEREKDKAAGAGARAVPTATIAVTFVRTLAPTCSATPGDDKGEQAANEKGEGIQKGERGEPGEHDH